MGDPNDRPDPIDQTGLTARQGLTVNGADPQRLAAAIELAFDYRGDVTVIRSSDAPVEGYIFDRAAGPSPGESYIRVIAKESGERIRVSYAEITELTFTGRDTAEGKSFETWMKKYVEKKLAGEEASIHSEPLDE